MPLNYWCILYPSEFLMLDKYIIERMENNGNKYYIHSQIYFCIQRGKGRDVP